MSITRVLRRSIEVAIGLVGLIGVSTQAMEKPVNRPNILFILTDNQPASIIGTYGNPEVRTPNIDRLAQEGVQFNHFFAVNGMCSPTRATLMTGLMPSQHGIHNWLDDRQMANWPRDWSAIAEFRTLPVTLRHHGYRTAMIGKWHLGQPWEPSLGYEYWVTLTIGHTVDFWDNEVVDNGEVKAIRGRHIVDYFTDKAVQYIENYEGSRPFYLQLNYDGPYLNPPTNAGPAKNRFYKEYVGKEFKSFPRTAFNENMARQLLEDEKHDPFVVEKIFEALMMHNDPATMANVASQNTLVDDGIGRVLDALKRAGLDDNTLIIFSSDQGNFYGQHGLWEHTVMTTPSNLYETAMNIPLIFRHKGHIKASRKTDALVAQYDLPATILDYVGINDVEFPNSPGRSFAAQLDPEKAPEGRKSVFFEQEETRGVRTDRFAFWMRIEGTGEPELYDMKADPEQTTNLYGRADYAAIVSGLSQLLTDFFERYSDPQYDLWKGGTAKGSVVRPEMFKRLYGDKWEPQTKILPKFSPGEEGTGPKGAEEE